MPERPESEDRAMRELMNGVIAKFNECVTQGDRQDAPIPARKELTARIGELWSGYFEGGRFADSDADVIGVLLSFPKHYWPDGLYLPARLDTAAYFGTALVARTNASRLKPESRYLNAFVGDETSQGGENGVIAKIFEIMGARNNWCVEFGAWDGKRHSNTWPLVAEQGWNGVLIEGHEGRFAQLQANYQGNERAHLFNMMVGFDADRDSIDHILARAGAPEDVDLMIVDIDGNDWHVWQSMTVHRPRLMVVEFNPTIANDIIYVQKRDPAVQQGCSLAALIELAGRKGYELVCATPFNGMFVPREEFPAFGIADNSIDAMYAPVMDARIFHAYDSTVHVAGMHYLLWDWNDLGSDWTRLVPQYLVTHDLK